jgi:hypothetical protein
MNKLLVSELEFVDTGNAPEYFIEAIGRRDILPGGIVRSFACTRSGNMLVPQYSYVASIAQLSLMARATLDACAKMHTEVTLADWTVVARH